MTLSTLLVTPDGRLRAGAVTYACALGKGGLTADKREGDGATPIGLWPLRRVLYRPDRVDPPRTALPVVPIDPADSWCDDPGHADYNRPVRLPHPARHEVLWRQDSLYDVVVVVGHNDDPPVPGAGSAIFLHVAGPGYAATEGCVALALPDLLAVLAASGPRTTLTVTP